MSLPASDPKENFILKFDREKNFDTGRILDYIKTGPFDKIKVAVTDIDGILRGKIMHREKFLQSLSSGFGFCDVVFGWDMGDRCYDNSTYTGWHSGYPDALARLDLTTFRQIPWDNNVPLVLGDFYLPSSLSSSSSAQAPTPLEICPRQLLKKVKLWAQKMGFQAVFSQEFEWFNFRENPQDLQQKEFRQIQPLTPGMFGYSIIRSSQNSAFFNDLFNLLGSFNIPLEGLHTETGPGVYEAAIMYNDVLESADRAVLFKTAVKEIAHRHGIMASFMAKWDKDYPGCGGHIHQSIWDREGHKNLFYEASDPQRMSTLFRHYVAGQLYCLPHILPMFAPTVNSYKRLVEGAWAPTTLTWGIDNRTTALRVLPGGEKSTRLEHRVVGSDTNPYLAMAASLAAGLYGIQNKIPLTVPETHGNGYRQEGNGRLPHNLEVAAEKMSQSAVARELFGEVFVQHFTQSRFWEWRESQKVVTDWELRRYFEII